MENEIYRYVENLISQRIGARDICLPEYDDLTGRIEGMFTDKELRDTLKELYAQMLDRRRSLCECESFDLTSNMTEFSSRVRLFLNSLRRFFRAIYENAGKLDENACGDVLRHVLECDMRAVDSGNFYEPDSRTISVGLGNPMILETLLIAMFQRDDCEKLVSDMIVEKESVMCEVYAELLRVKTEGLFRGIELLFDGEFYRIVAFDPDGMKFVARRETDLCSLEGIYSHNLYEKIVNGVAKDGGPVECVVVGLLKDANRKILDALLADGGYGNVSVRYIEKKNEIRAMLTDRSEMTKLIERYDKLFVLDCPEIYSAEFVYAAFDYTDVLKKSDRSVSDILSADGGMRDFDNANGFANLYYRVQNRLLRPDFQNVAKKRRVNANFFGYLNEIFSRDGERNSCRPEYDGKEVYIYLSDAANLYGDALFGRYDFARQEMHNAKVWRVIKFSARRDVSFTLPKKAIDTTYYRILRSLSDSPSFLCGMTGDSMVCTDGETYERARTAIKAAKETQIVINYDKLVECGFGKKKTEVRLETVATSKRGDDVTRDTMYRHRLKALLRSVFDPEGKCFRTENKALVRCFHRAVADTLRGCAKNYNDLLFVHLYEKWDWNTGGDIMFIPYVVTDVPARSDCWDCEEQTSYSHKITATTIIKSLDAGVFRKSDAVSYYRIAAMNGDSLEDYVSGLSRACEELGYSYGRLYSELKKMHI